MFSIERRDFGFSLVFEGFISEEEMSAWLDRVKLELASSQGSFGVLVDMRGMKALPPAAKEVIAEGQRLFKRKGMARSAVALASRIVAIQFKSIAQETGIYEWERYIDASARGDWEAVALGWIVDAIDPDK